jgi:hypothetical protein
MVFITFPGYKGKKFDVILSTGEGLSKVMQVGKISYKRGNVHFKEEGLNQSSQKLAEFFVLCTSGSSLNLRTGIDSN